MASAWPLVLAAASESELGTFDDLASAQQTSLARALRGTNDVAVAVDAIGGVDVKAPGWAEHRRVARSLAVVRVCGGVLGAKVGLDFRQADADAIEGERGTQKLRRHHVCGSREINH